MSRSIPPLHLDPFAAALADPAAPPPSALTQKLAGGAYEVGSVIGVGTYGEVRYAVNVATGERVAIKIVDLARFSRETAGLMRKEIAILRLLGSHPHCIRIIQVHENVPFAGKWCESCACTRFKRRSEEKEQQEATAAAAAGAAAGPAHPARPAHPTKRPPLVSTSPCATCSHSAAEHSGVSYQHDPSFRAHHSHGGAQPDDDDDEDDLGETRQVMLIVQELGSGGELFSLLAHSGPLPEDVARLYFQQLISGMEHLHSLSIAHRDIKPENLVLNEEFQLKIADFGLASLGTPIHPHDAHNSTLAHTHAAGQPVDSAQPGVPDVRHYSGVGSQPYSAPECYYVRELYGGRGYRGAPCDVWSAAVCLFVMLVGRPPFVRPLAKTYGSHMRRCRHFVNILSGSGLDMLHPHAKDLLQKLLKLAPQERLTIAQMKLHPWMLGPVPSHEELVKIMNERSMLSWQHSCNHEMTHVLSNMRSSKAELPSNQGTPHFGAQSPSGSPSLDPHTALNSPSFSALASSVPPSPFAAAHAYAYHSAGGQRAASPDSQQLHHRYSTVSPASFVPQGQSAFLSPNAAHHSSGGAGLAFLPPPNLGQATQAARGHSAAAHAESVESAPVPVTIASSINASAPSLLRPHATPALLSVALTQINVTTAPPLSPVLPAIESLQLSDAHGEIPPPLPLPPTPVSPTPPAAAVESKQEAHARKKLAAFAEQVESAQRQAAEAEKKKKQRASAGASRVITPLKRAFSHTRHSTSPPHAQHAPHDGHASGGDESPRGAAGKNLALSTSHSYPPRVSYASFTSSLDYDTLLGIIQSRLEKQNGTRFHAVPPRGKLQGTVVKMKAPQQQPTTVHQQKKAGSPTQLQQQQQQQLQQQHAHQSSKSPQSTSPQHSPRRVSGGAGAASPRPHSPAASSASVVSTVDTDEESLLHCVTSWHGAHIVALISIRTIRQNSAPNEAVAAGPNAAGASAAAGPGSAASGAGVSAACAAPLVSRLPKGRLVIAEKIRAADPRAFQAWFEAIAAGLRED